MQFGRVALGTVAITILAAVWATSALWELAPLAVARGWQDVVGTITIAAGQAVVALLLFRSRVRLARWLFAAADAESSGDEEEASPAVGGDRSGDEVSRPGDATDGSAADARSVEGREPEGGEASASHARWQTAAELQAAALGVAGVLLLYWTCSDVLVHALPTFAVSSWQPIGELYPTSSRIVHALQFALGLFLFCRSRMLAWLWLRSQSRRQERSP